MHETSADQEGPISCHYCFNDQTPPLGWVEDKNDENEILYFCNLDCMYDWWDEEEG